jgi:hypothetical protein
MYYNAHHGQDCTLRGGMALRFCTENEEQRKWKTSIKVNRGHVPKTAVFDTTTKELASRGRVAYKSCSRKLAMPTGKSLASDPGPCCTPSLVSFCSWTSRLLHQRCGGKQEHSFDDIL